MIESMRATFSWQSVLRRQFGRWTLGVVTFAAAGLSTGLQIYAWKEALAWQAKVRLPRHVVAADQRSRFRTANVYMWEGKNLLQQGSVDGAIAQYHRALEFYPHLPAAHNNLGFAYLAQGDVGKAIEQYRRTLEINPADKTAHFNLGVLLDEMGDRQAAVGHFRRVVEIDPRDEGARMELCKLVKNCQEGPETHR